MADEDDAARGARRFQIVFQGDGRYHWRLFNPQGTPQARSMDSYATEDEAVAAAEEARRLISGAPITRSANV